MGRKLKRVPLDFDWPIDEIWKGYDVNIVHPGHSCQKCEEVNNNCDESASYCALYNPESRRTWFYDPPKGEGYQMWEDTSKGSPQSPVFKTFEELCQWLEETKASWFGDVTATKEEWANGLKDGLAGFLIMTKTVKQE